MYCGKCGKQNPDVNQFCGFCGYPLLSQSGNLSNGSPPQHPFNQPINNPVYPNMANSDLHIKPGPAQYVAITSNKSKATATVLCLLGFIGIAGLHRLYVGKILSGVLYFITLGFFFIGTIIDLIQLLLGQFSDNVYQPLRK